MRIVSWNCNGGLRHKAAEADALQADVLVIQECEDPSFYGSSYRDWAGNYLWVGTSKSKGIGIFPRGGVRIERLLWNGEFSIDCLSNTHKSTSWATSDLKLFLPFRINDQINVLAVWTKGNRDEVFGYIGQLWKYLQIHRKELSSPKTLVVGDLNSNAIWDKNDRWWSHTGVVSELAEIGLRSVYHEKKHEEHGAESEPTFFLQRNLKKSYHIDYVFSSPELLPKTYLTIGHPSHWIKLSDHMPLLIEVEQEQE
jgi:exonuclease III